MKWKTIKNEDVVKQFFENRGFKSQKEIDDFLNFNSSKLRKKYKDLTKVVNRLAKAVKNNERIVVYGDYDCDGICATTINYLAFKNLGIEVGYHINNRFNEGYGLNIAGMNNLIEKYPDVQLILTCDNGIAAQEGIKYALDKGIDVVCTDHHLQKGEIIVPTVDEWRDDEDSKAREECCGAEIARRVMLALYKKLDKPTDYVENLITFSGISTVADVVKFTAANRWIVKRCLELLNKPVFPIVNMIKAGMNIAEVDEEDLGYKIGPLMNCLSRVTGNAEEMVKILTSEKNTIEAWEKVMKAVEVNEQRKEMTNTNLVLAKSELNENDSCVILAGAYDPGIAGLVASNIVEEYSKPCICLEDRGDILKGSARTYLDFHLKNALDECKDLLLGYGGHAGAAGLSLKKENLQAFKDRMNSLVKKSGVLEKEPEVIIDYECSISNMFDENVEKLYELAPFGEGFAKPRIVYTGGFKTVSFSPKDEELKKHVAFTLKDEEGECKAVWWNAYNRWNKLGLNKKDIIGVMATPRIDTFNNVMYRKLYVEDIKREM